MNSGNLFVLVTAIMTLIGVLAAYMAANTYRLPFNGVLGVLILAGLFNSLAMRMIKLRGAPESIFSAGMGALLIALVGAILTLVILASRFGFGQGLGLALVAGLSSSLINYFVKSL
jgi:hypothetical protein